MPEIGIIRGFGEGYIATKYIIKLIKALNKRFRSHIKYAEIPCGSCIDHGTSLSPEALRELNNYDCIYIGDFYSQSNPVDYEAKDIAYALSANIEYTHVSGIREKSDVDVCIAAYFDGGSKMREVSQTGEGCTETRVCSAYVISNIVKNVSRYCEKRRRRLAFVTDDDNGYCAAMFLRAFESFVFPLSNFKLTEYTSREICRDILYDPSVFDVIFSSPAFSQTVPGAFEFIMKDNFTFYKRYNSEKTVYSLHALQANSACGDYLPSLYSYIEAFCDMLNNEFNMQKEAAHLRRATEEAINLGASCDEGEKFLNAVIAALYNPVTTKYSKEPVVSRYIK